MKKLVAVTLAALLPAFLLGCSQETDGQSPALTGNPGELAVCVGPNPDTIDPALNSSVDGATLIIHGFEGLFTLDEQGVPVPGQAESVQVSDDGTVYTFHLRQGLKWSDSSPLTAEDFVYSWNRAISADTAADYAYLFQVIRGYEEKSLDAVALDASTLQVTLKNPCAYFLELTAFPTYMPVQRAAVEANGQSWAIRPETYIGNGPYKMVEWVSGSHILYAKNENYWNYENLGPETIRFVLMEDAAAQLMAYRSGGLAFIDNIPNDDIALLSQRADFYKEGQLGTYYVSFNVSDPALSNPRLRQALTLAIDRQWLCVNVGQAGQIPAGAFVSLGLSDAQGGSSFRQTGGDYFDPYDYEGNLEQAKEILAELYPDGNYPSFEYVYNADSSHQKIGEALQRDWGVLGIAVTLRSEEWGTFLNTRKAQQYQIARNGWLNDYNDPIGMLDLWVTGGGNNDAGWSNAQYDQLIETAKNSGDPAQRFAAMHQAEDILFEEWVLCPIYYYVDVYLLNSAVKGVWSSPLGYKYFMYAVVE